MNHSSHSVFNGYRLIASGSLAKIALVVRRAIAADSLASILVFDNETGRSIDIDTRGTDDDVVARYAPAATDAARASEPRSRGRPKLGVVAREVTLLPRHWDWLGQQPGGASVALRKLVEQASRQHAGSDSWRDGQERAYQFMSEMACDLPGFAEAAHALFADDRVRFGELIAGWPDDVRKHAFALAFEDVP
jgi:hypothetical protein